MSLPILVSGIQPSNNLTLGNYLGAIKQFTKLQKDYHNFLFIADYHLLSSNQVDHQVIKHQSYQIIKWYLASGIDVNQAHIFLQSDVREHLELAYLLMVHTSIGELSRMTQFKDKSAQIKVSNNTTTIPSGLLFYPILMAADILIYDANLVPVGQDQKQHLELTRTIAERINNKFQTKLFTIPEVYIPKVAAKVMDLQIPKIKMSKSAPSDKGVIFLAEPVEQIRQKIMKAQTDSFNNVQYDPINQPGVSNLIEIYCAITNEPIAQFVTAMKNHNYGQFKTVVADVVCKFISELQVRVNLISDQDVQALLAKNAQTCRKLALKKVLQLQRLLGLSYEY